MLRPSDSRVTVRRCRRRRVGATVAAALAAVTLALPVAALAQGYPPSAGTLGVSNTAPAPGELITVSGDGYAAGTGITITFESDPVTIGNVNADASGAFTAQVRIPADATPGNHTIKATGMGADGATRVTSAAVTVTGGSTGSGGSSANSPTAAPAGGGSSANSPTAAPATASRTGRLAFTGLEVVALCVFGLTLLCGGVVLVTMARRRRSVGAPTP